MSERRPMDLAGVADEDALVLAGWPEGTRGRQEEEHLVRLLNALCKRHGYGRVPQLAQQLEDIWRHPEKAEEYRRIRDELQGQIDEGIRLAEKRLADEAKDERR